MYDLTVLQQYGVTAEQAQQLAVVLSNNYGDSFGESFPRLSLKGSRFTLRNGSSEDFIANDQLDVIILGDAADDHCVYFKDKYDPTKTDVAPTAVWYMKQPAPVVVPPTVLQRGPDGRFGYVRQHRAVILIKDPLTGKYNDTPVVYDIGAMSLYGQDLPMADGSSAMGYASLRRWCSAQRILPCLFETRIIFDRRATVPCVRFIPSRNGSAPMLLTPDVLNPVLKLAASPTVKDLLQVKLIDGTEADVVATDFVNDEAAAAQPAPQAAPKAPRAKAKTPVAPQPAPAPAPQPKVVPQQPQVVPSVAPAVPPVAPVVPQAAPAPQPVVEQSAPAPQDALAAADAALGSVAGMDNELASLLAQAKAL